MLLRRLHFGSKIAMMLKHDGAHLTFNRIGVENISYFASILIDDRSVRYNVDNAVHVMRTRMMESKTQTRQRLPAACGDGQPIYTPLGVRHPLTLLTHFPT